MKKLSFLLLLLLSINGYSQNSSLYFEHQEVARGLSESFITALNQDKPGYLWIGIQNGLVVKGHGGTITVGNKEGEGEFTEFIISIPIS
jgi:ligand-binding sensor domain-containing protein